MIGGQGMSGRVKVTQWNQPDKIAVVHERMCEYAGREHKIIFIIFLLFALGNKQDNNNDNRCDAQEVAILFHERGIICLKLRKGEEAGNTTYV